MNPVPSHQPMIAGSKLYIWLPNTVADSAGRLILWLIQQAAVMFLHLLSITRLICYLFNRFRSHVVDTSHRVTTRVYVLATPFSLN